MHTKIDEWNNLPEDDKQLINILNQVQEELGYIPHHLFSEIACKAGIPEAQLLGLATFFDSYRSRPVGKHKLSICYGTACYARGAPLINDRLADELELSKGEDTSADGFVTVDQVYCVGACSQAPLVIIDGQISGKIKSYQVPLILDNMRKKE